MDKKNISFCFYGQVRLFEIIDYYKKWNNRQDKYHFDFFISTWNDFKDKSFLNFFNEVETIDQTQIEWINVPGNTKKMSYLLKSVNNLFNSKKQKKYDMVIYLRPDSYINFEDLMKLFEERWDEFTEKENTVLTLSQLRLEKDFGYLDSDFAFIGTEIGFNNHSKIYDRFFGENRYYKKTSFKNGHYVHGRTLSDIIDNVIYIKVFNLLIRPKRDIDIITKWINSDNFRNEMVKNIRNWTHNIGDGYSDDYIKSGSTIINFKEGIME